MFSLTAPFAEDSGTEIWRTLTAHGTMGLASSATGSEVQGLPNARMTSVSSYRSACRSCQPNALIAGLDASVSSDEWH